MFDANDGKSKSGRAQVSVTLMDGTSKSVAMRLPLSNKLHDALNNAEPFIDVLEADGRQAYIAKHAIRRVEVIDVPRANQMNQKRRSSDNAMFDPYAVLGIQRGASQADVKLAYHTMARTYHPDRFETLDLPREIKDYAVAMLVRINLAYEQLGS